ncbi:peptidoglycan glycosyltransferase, partial [Anoxybacillus ayderensis]
RPELIAPKERFHMPGGIVQRSYCAISGLLPSETCKRFGLIESDLFNTAFVPKTEDTYLISGAFVELNGERYTSLPTTPKEFTKEGVMIDASLLEQWGIQHIKDLSKLLPQNDKWKHVFVAKTLQENGKKPDPLAAQQKGTALVWNEHHEQDVIGYRVYYAASETATFQVIATIRKGEQKNIPLKQGIYYVTAVDIAGLESNPSNIIRMLPAIQPEQPVEEQPSTN